MYLIDENGELSSQNDLLIVFKFKSKHFIMQYFSLFSSSLVSSVNKSMKQLLLRNIGIGTDCETSQKYVLSKHRLHF